MSSVLRVGNDTWGNGLSMPLHRFMVVGVVRYCRYIYQKGVMICSFLSHNRLFISRLNDFIV